MIDFDHLFLSNYIHVKQSYRVQSGYAYSYRPAFIYSTEVQQIQSQTGKEGWR